MFWRRRKPIKVPAARKTELPAEAKKTLAEIFEHGCELARPPAALVARFHDQRIGGLLDEMRALEARLEMLVAEASELAADLKPVQEQERFGTALREALTKRMSGTIH